MIPLPASFGLALDRSVRCYRDGHVLVGGAPLRALRLTAAGRAAVRALLAGTEPDEAGRRLARRLVDAGLAHPRPGPATAVGTVTVVVPTRDRPRELDRCLGAIDGVAPAVVVDDGSVDAARIADVCRRRGARLIRRERCGGPAVARNTALAEITSELVAFLDSDCTATHGWLDTVTAHFADPLVGAVAPRVRPAYAARPGSLALDCYLAARSPLDMGPCAGRVVPGGRISYVPTAALVVRRGAIDGFDPRLRFGEDVDLIWRLHDAGWHVRYEPAATVHHDEPRSWTALLRRRRRYGTSAAPLERRHPGRLTPLVARPWPMASALLLLARRPRAAAIAVAADAAVLAHRAHRAGVPAHRAAALSAKTAALTLVGCSRVTTMLAAPALAAGLGHRRSRSVALSLLLAAPLHEWAVRRPPLDAARWALASMADDVAYGLGVWESCLRERTVRPLLPAIKAAR